MRAATRSRTFATTRRDCPAAPATRAGASRTAACSAAFPPIASMPPGLAVLNIYPAANLSGAGDAASISPARTPTANPRREDLLRMDFQATDNWRVTGRYMKTTFNQLQAYGTTWAGNGSDQLPTPTLFKNPGANYMLSATGILNDTTSVELSWGRASNSLNYDLQLDNLRASNAGTAGLPLLFPEAQQGDYVPWFQFRNGRTGNAGPVPDRPRALHQREHHPRRRRPTSRRCSAGTTPRPASTSSTATSRRASSRASTAPSTSPTTPTTRSTPGTATPTRRRACSTPSRRPTSSRIPEWRYKNIEFYLQDNWRANRKLTLDYGVRFYYLTPQWDTTLQASNFLPDQFDARNAARALHAGLHRRLAVRRRQPSRHRPAPARRRARRRRSPTPSRDGSSAVSRRAPTASTARSRRARVSTTSCRTGHTFQVSPRFGFVYDFTGEAVTILRGGWGIFYDRPQGNMVFDMIANAPGVLNSTLQWGRLQELTSAGGDPIPTLSLNPTAYNFVPPTRHAVERRRPAQAVEHASCSTWRTSAPSPTTCCARCRSTRCRSARRSAPRTRIRRARRAPAPGATALPNDLLRPYPGYGNIRMWGYDGYSNYHALQTGVNRRFDNGFMFSFFYVWSKALGINNDDFAAGVPEHHRGRNAATRLLVPVDRPPAQLRDQLHLPDADVTSSRVLGLLANDVAGVGHLPLDERPAVRRRLQHPGHRRRRT